MRVRCPHCHNPIEVVDGDPLSQVDCPSCGSSFSLVATFETVSHEPREPKKIAHFDLIEQVGMGRFGSVWKARDTQLDRAVAIKLPRKGSLDPAESEQFLREARAAAQVRHPHIVPVHEVGREGDSLYIVSDFIDGANLKDWLTGQRPTPREAAELCVTIAQALHAAHEAGVTHRDLKPGNILMDLQGRPHIADFGLARRDAGEITMTVEGRLLGTPAYMPPEQARGEGHMADRRSDVYSLGVILYELLTGELPFRGESRMLIVQVIRDEPPSPRKLNARIPRDLETIALKCLEKEPGRRYPTAQALAEDLRRWLAGEAIHARPIGRAARAYRWCRRKPMAAALIGVAALLPLVLGIVAVREAGLRTKAQSALDGETAALGKAKEQTAIAEREVAATQRQIHVANARRLAAESGRVRREFPVQSTLLALAAIDATAAHGEPELAAAENELRDSLGVLGGVAVSGQDAPVTAVAFSPDGRWLVTRSEDNTARVWDLAAADPAAEPKILRGHEDGTYCLAISPDSRWLVTGGGDKTARVWDLAAADPAAEPKILRGHQSNIDCLAISPDSRWLVTGGGDNTARVWDLAAADPSAEPKILRGHEAAVACLAISPDGRWLVSGSYDLTARAWDLAAADPAAKPKILRGHESYITCLAISPDSRWLVTGSGGLFASLGTDHTARVWDLAAADPAAEPKVLRGHERHITCLAISPAGRWLVTGSEDNTARVWDLAAADPTVEPRILRGHESPVLCLAISPDSRWLVTGSFDNTARVWDLAATDPSAEPIVLRAHEAQIHCLAISPDGHWLVTGSEDKSARVWDLATADPAAEPKILRGHENKVQSLAISPDGRWLVTGSHDKTARVWDLAAADPAAEPMILHGHEEPISCLAISPAGRWLVTGSWDKTARVWDLAAADPAAEPKILRGHENSVSCLAISPDGRWLVTGSRNNTARVWDLAAADPAAEPKILRGHEDRIDCLAISPDSRWLVTGSSDKTARVWDLAAADPAAQPKILRGHEGRIFRLAISPDGRWLVTGSSDDNTARVWDLATADPAAEPRILRADVACLAISPDGRWLVTGSWDKTARVWDLAAADPEAEPKILRGHQSNIDCLAISPDSRWLVTGGEDNTARVWDLAAADPTAEPKILRGHEAAVICLAISPDGRWLVTGSRDWTARVWRVRSYDLIDVAKNLVGRELTPDERQQYQNETPAGINHALRTNWSAFLQRYREHQATGVVELVDREASRLVDELLARTLLTADARAAIDADPTLRDDVRLRAIELIDGLQEDSTALNSASWNVVREPSRSPDEYALAVRQAEAACRLSPDDRFALNTLGAAQYRAGDYDKALETLTHSRELNSRTLDGQSHPADIAFLAMTHHRLGHAEDAARRLAELRALMQQDDWKPQADLQQLLAEVEALIACELPRREDL